MSRGRRRRPALPTVLAAFAGLLLAGCHTTVDSLGYNDTVLHLPLSGPSSYPNAFRDLIGKTEPEIAAKIAAAYAQLFHGDPLTEAIYFPVAGTDQAYIRDILHGDVRTEGIGYGMLISVELDKRDELDRLWRYAKANMRVAAGPAAGYFLSTCDVPDTSITCLDPFGLQQFVMALLFAHDRWGSAPPGIDYAADVKLLFNVMRHKQDENGGIVDGVTDVFDATTGLPFDLPHVRLAQQSRPSVAMPAYYELWARATADPFWSRAAASARAYWRRATNGATGLSPSRARFDGTPIAGSEVFAPESYRMQVNLALDRIWGGGDAWEVAVADLLIRFFTTQGVDRYGDSFTLDGVTVLDPTHDSSLVAANGAAALVATTPERVAFVDAVWNMDIPSGLPRYYSGLLHLMSLLALGGQMQVR